MAAVYFITTGLHSLHVTAGIIVPVISAGRDRLALALSDYVMRA